MINHIQISFAGLQPEQQELLIAHLAEAGFDGFEEGEEELKAFISEPEYDKELLKEIAFKYQVHFSEQLIPARNWNAAWEAGFQPAVIGDFVGIRADFHSPVPGVTHEIIITPKMSFGTGHHASTRLMIEQMREIPFGGRTVFDFGTGSGILSILAKKLGARRILAVDMDAWSIANARENFERNGCAGIELRETDRFPEEEIFDIILANLHKNLIIENFPLMAQYLAKKNGDILLSGLLEGDEGEIRSHAQDLSLHIARKMTMENWICLRLNR